ncbi:single-stranded DNA-binding protein-like protein [Phocid alphaherpesvirus 1]|uniref:Single-stranded DNA-binding protein-like protein n=1 Tax=Phocid alphaherpesvirus 1 TaxID=47418 RepID=A0A482F4E1_9ALPH|nr:single-stranded DNA-binding protein-like protein [Phocid alphaherpesvirus 1]QBN85150.1 single-stranded DNA-binding protein-like protein [Phocid alphaherpesvirus 1]UNP64251.1 single-stranded DNA-binding protein-like protein [Phocid alphaherpesvirus 1]
MEAAPKTISLPSGPLGYIYARHFDSLQLSELSLLSARSADSDLAVLPVIQGLTVESGFVYNVAVLSGSKTSGLNGSGVTFKLTPSHFHPNAFVFYGGDVIPPSSTAPNLKQACEFARRRFGFSSYSKPPVDNVIETSGESICETLNLDKNSTMLYLVVTETFKEVVYICNSFIHYGGMSIVTINSHDVIRIPLYPIQLYMPDVNRISTEPFNTKHRSINEEFVYTPPFFNSNLCSLIHAYVLGPAAVSLRVRNLDSLARGSAHLAFDENHEGSVLPSDISFTHFEVSQSGSKGRSGTPRGGETSSGKVTTNGLERRLASVMAADATLSIDALIGAGIYDDPIPDYGQWPMFANLSETERLDALGAYMARMAGLVSAMIFSSNSVLYMTEVDDGGVMEGKDGPNPSYNRFYLIAAPHVAGNPQTDKDGRILKHTENQPVIPINGSGHEFSLDHLALVCGFCPQILAKILFYLERSDSGVFIGRNDVDALKYLTNTFDLDVPCNLCDKKTRPVCAHTTIYRLRQRLPKFGNPNRSPMGIFGTMNSTYSDCDVLGNYASYGALRKPNDSETTKSIMQDTYKAMIDKLLNELEQNKIIDKEALTLPGGGNCLTRIITDHQSFRSTLTTTKNIIEQTVDQFMKNLVENRDFKIRDALGDANHTMSLSIDPLSQILCPVTSFLNRRTLLAVIQDLVLSQCHCVFYGQLIEGRNFRVQFQPVLRRRFMDLLNAGFITAKTVTVTLSDSGVIAPDLTKPPSEPPVKECDGDLAKVSMEVLRDLRIKNRVIFSTSGGSNLSEAARARVAGMTSSYQRPERHSNMLTGAVGFLLKQFHEILFPNGHPPGSKTPNPQWYWTLLQRNQMPARLLSKEEIETITTVKRFSDEYSNVNFINLVPNNMGELAQFYAANLILKYCDHNQFFINSTTAILGQAKKPKDPASVLSWITKCVDEVSDIELAANDVLSTIHDRHEIWTGTYTSTNMVRIVMATKPSVVLGVSISKYNGSAGNNRVFQSCNWSGLNGGKNVCPLMSFDRTRRFILACPRVGFTCEAGNIGNGARENSLNDTIRSIISDGGPLVQTSIFSAVLNALGSRTQHLEIEDWQSIVEDEYLAIAMKDINTRISKHSSGWSMESAYDVIKELESLTNTAIDENESVTFDFGACSSGVMSSNIENPSQSLKRPSSDDLFDMGNVAEKRPALTFDML